MTEPKLTIRDIPWKQPVRTAAGGGGIGIERGRLAVGGDRVLAALELEEGVAFVRQWNTSKGPCDEWEAD